MVGGASVLCRWRLIWAGLLLGALLPASVANADRYWDVKPQTAEALVKRLPGRVVLEYCAGCGGSFSAYRVDDARVEKGDYSDGKQILVKRRLLLVGESPGAFRFSNEMCGVPAASSSEPSTSDGWAKLDFPYAYLNEGTRWEWVGVGTAAEERASTAQRAPLAMSAASFAALRRCVGAEPAAAVRAPPMPATAAEERAAAVVKRGRGVHTWRFDLDRDGRGDVVQAEIVRKARRFSVRPPRPARVETASLRVSARWGGGGHPTVLFELPLLPTAKVEPSAWRVQVAGLSGSSKDAPNQWVVQASAQAVRVFFLVEQQGRAALVHALGTWPSSWGARVKATRFGGLSVQARVDGELLSASYDAESQRVLGRGVAWVMVDDLNVRAAADRKAAVVGKVDRDQLVRTSSPLQEGWARVQAAVATGVVWARFVSPRAPLYDARHNGLREQPVLFSVGERQALELTDPRLEALQAYREEARAARAPAQICAALTHANALVLKLEEPLMQAWGDYLASDDAILDTSTLLARLDRMTPGITVEMGADRFSVLRAPGELADALEPASPTAEVLRAAQALAGAAWPVWTKQTWDLGGCARPARAAHALKLLGRSWAQAPTCVKKQLQAEIDEAIGELVSQTCFCRSKRQVQRAIKRKVLPQLRALKAFDGATRAATLNKNLSRKDAQFSSLCGG